MSKKKRIYLLLAAAMMGIYFCIDPVAYALEPAQAAEAESVTEDMQGVTDTEEQISYPVEETELEEGDKKADVTTDGIGEYDLTLLEDVQSMGEAVQTAGEKRVVYTQVRASLTDSSGDGTKANPYNRLEDAVDNVSDGGTIYILDGNGAFLNTQDEYGNVPYVINKNVTIEAAPGIDMANLSVRAAGIILGGDVTFRNIGLGFVNKYHDSIFANGHTLILDRVSRNSGTRQVDLFAGGLYQTNGSVLGPAPSDNGKIILRGTGEFGNIYAGSMNGSYTGNVSISIEQKQNLEGTIYGSGAKEPELQDNNWFDMTEPPAPEADAVHYPVNGNVDIQLSDISVRTIEGAGTSGDLNVALGTDYPANIALKHISKLTVTKGRIIPLELSAGASGILDLDLRSGAEAEFTNVPGKTVRNFIGGGVLILGKTDTFTITGSVTGQTKFLTAGGLMDKSGSALPDHTYIKGHGSENNFTFEPAESQKGMRLEYKTDTGEWKTTTADDDQTLYADYLEFERKTDKLDYNEVNGTGAPPELPVVWRTSQTGPWAVFELLPLQYEVQYGGNTYKADILQPDADNNYRGQIPELHMELIGYDDMGTSGKALITLGILRGNAASEDGNGNPLPVAEGVYKITAIAPKSDGTEIRSTTEVTIEDSSAVRYSVKYFQQNADDNGYTEVKADAEERRRGIAGADAEITAQNYLGFESVPIVKYSDSSHKTETTDVLKVSADSSLQVSVYYDRKTYSLSYRTSGIPQGTVGMPEDPKPQQNIRYGQTVRLAEKLKFEGWTMSDWYSNDIMLTGDSFRMPMKDVLIQAKWNSDADKLVKANVKYSSVGEPVNLEMNGTRVMPPESGDKSSYETGVTFKAGASGKTVTIRMGVLFAYEFRNITINGTDYSQYIPKTEKELLDAFRNQQTWIEFEISRAGNEIYEIKTVTAPASKFAVGNLLWTYDKDKKYIKDENGNDILNDDYIENGKIELLAVQYGGITYSGKELEEHLENGSAFDWGETEADGESVFPVGTIVTVKLIPDYGYQLTSFGINGGVFDTDDQDSTFKFEIRGGNFHLATRFTKVDHKVQSNANAVTGGSVNVSEDTVNAGTVVLSVEDAAMTETEKQAFSKIGNTEYEVLHYLDLNLTQIIYKGTDDENNVWSTPIGKTSELKQAAVVSLNLKEDVDKSCVILHEKHNGTYEVIDPQYNVEGQTLTFATKEFSNYAIALKKQQNTNPGTNTDRKDTVESADKKAMTTISNMTASDTDMPDARDESIKESAGKAPKTGDETPTTLLMLLLAMGAVIVSVAYAQGRRTKKYKKRKQ